MRLEGWHWVGTFTGVVLLTVAALPFAAFAAWALARRRRLAGATAARARRMSLAEGPYRGLPDSRRRGCRRRCGLHQIDDATTRLIAATDCPAHLLHTP